MKLRKEIEKLIENANIEELPPFIDLILTLRENNDDEISKLHYVYEYNKDCLYVSVEEYIDGEKIIWDYNYTKEEIAKNLFRELLIYFGYFTKNNYDLMTFIFYRGEIEVKDEVIEFIKNNIK